MRILTQIVGSFVEAWGEVKVQKTRVVLSLVGVVAAVAAMSVVIAMGDLIVQSQLEYMEKLDGRSITLHLEPSKSGDSEAPTVDGGGVVYGVGGVANDLATVESADASGEETEGWTTAATGVVNDPVGKAMTRVAERFEIPYWSHKLQSNLQLRELVQVQNTGTFRGVPVTAPEWGYQDPMITAVDPDYMVLYRLKLLHGRWLSTGDDQPRATPVVINEILWEYLGKPNIADPLVLNSNDETPLPFRVVGVTKKSSNWDTPEMFVLYDAWQLIKTGDSQSNPAMLVWTDKAQADEARRVLPKALASVLGEGWTVNARGGEQWDGGQSQMQGITQTIMIIGGIVVFLGALGLLNVAIVTVRQRIREIGIRRAMGASAVRIFFAVFMESVVATLVAGVLGVAIGVVVLRYIPLDALGIFLQDVPAFPMRAAIAGVAISVSVGALCGIIPAFAAVKVKPIDAIRS